MYLYQHITYMYIYITHIYFVCFFRMPLIIKLMEILNNILQAKSIKMPKKCGSNNYESAPKKKKNVKSRQTKHILNDSFYVNFYVRNV